MVIVNAFAISSYAIAITDYLCVIFPALEVHRTLSSFLILTIFFLSTIRGSRFVTILENLVTLILIAALTLFVAFGIGKVDPVAFFNPSADGGFFRGGFLGFFSAIAVMGWAVKGLPWHRFPWRLLQKILRKQFLLELLSLLFYLPLFMVLWRMLQPEYYLMEKLREQISV